MLHYGVNVKTRLLLVCPPELTMVWSQNITGR